MKKVIFVFTGLMAVLSFASYANTQPADLSAKTETTQQQTQPYCHDTNTMAEMHNMMQNQMMQKKSSFIRETF